MFDDIAVAQRFSNAVKGYTTGQLAGAARASKPGAAHWVIGDRCPSLPKALLMGRSLPPVRDWILAELGLSMASDAQMRVLRAIVVDPNDMEKKPAAPSVVAAPRGSRRRA